MFSPQTYENKAEQIWSTIPPKLPLFYQDSFLMISNQLLKRILGPIILTFCIHSR